MGRKQGWVLDSQVIITLLWSIQGMQVGLGLAQRARGLFATKVMGVGGQDGSSMVLRHSICQAKHGETLFAGPEPCPARLPGLLNPASAFSCRGAAPGTMKSQENFRKGS